MVITRQQNSTAEANTSVKFFSKEQNDLKMKELKEYAANNAAVQYDLNLHVLGLYYSSTREYSLEPQIGRAWVQRV